MYVTAAMIEAVCRPSDGYNAISVTVTNLLWRRSDTLYTSGARFTKCLTIYYKII